MTDPQRHEANKKSDQTSDTCRRQQRHQQWPPGFSQHCSDISSDSIKGGMAQTDLSTKACNTVMAIVVSRMTSYAIIFLPRLKQALRPYHESDHKKRESESITI